MILKDYSSKPDRVQQLISEIGFDDLLDTEGISKLLFNRDSDESIKPRGYRILSRTGASEQDIDLLISSFKDLNGIMSLDLDALNKIFNNPEYSGRFQRELAGLRENIMVGKKI